MYPPEVGYLGSHGLWYPVRTRYRATRLRYVAPCGVGAYGSVLQAAGEEVKASYQPWVSYGTSISRYQRVSRSVRT